MSEILVKEVSSFSRNLVLDLKGAQNPQLNELLLKSLRTQQIIKEKIHTVIPKDQHFSHEDLNPEGSITQHTEGNTILKEIQFQVINLQ